MPGHALVAGDGPQTAGERGHKARHGDQDDVDHDPGERQPDPDGEPERGRDYKAPIVHGLAACTASARPGSPVLLVLKERHGALPWTQAGTPWPAFALQLGLCSEWKRGCACRSAHPS